MAATSAARLRTRASIKQMANTKIAWFIAAAFFIFGFLYLFSPLGDTQQALDSTAPIEVVGNGPGGKKPPAVMSPLEKLYLWLVS